VLDLRWPNVKSYHWFYLNRVREIPSRTPSQIRHAQFGPGTRMALHTCHTPLQLPPPSLSPQLSTEGHPLLSPIGGQTLTDSRARSSRRRLSQYAAFISTGSMGFCRTPENHLGGLCHGPDKNLTFEVRVCAKSGQFSAKNFQMYVLQSRQFGGCHQGLWRHPDNS
jgi:hypothetical protein